MTSNEIKQLTNMQDILNRYGLPQPNRSGFIRCPFHKGDREASMKIYPKDFNCFACGVNGDIFTFVQMMDHLSFKEAYHELGGSYINDFAAKMKIYRARKAREMAAKEWERIERKKRLNCLLISVYQKYLDRAEPLSDLWCSCYNALQYQIYLNEVYNDPEGDYGGFKQTK